MHVIKPLHALAPSEIRDLATHAAERGERLKDVNPFPRGTTARAVFSRAFARRAADLRPYSAS